MSIEIAGTMPPLIAQRKQKPVALRRVFQFSSPTPKNRLIGRSTTADPAACLDKAMQMHYLSQAAKTPILSGDCHDSARTRCLEAHGSVSDDRAGGCAQAAQAGQGRPDSLLHRAEWQGLYRARARRRG